MWALSPSEEDRNNRLDRERAIVKPQSLAHVVRRTRRFDELVQWYCTVLGAEVVHSDGMLAFLRRRQRTRSIEAAVWSHRSVLG